MPPPAPQIQPKRAAAIEDVSAPSKADEVSVPSMSTPVKPTPPSSTAHRRNGRARPAVGARWRERQKSDKRTGIPPATRKRFPKLEAGSGRKKTVLVLDESDRHANRAATRVRRATGTKAERETSWRRGSYFGAAALAEVKELRANEQRKLRMLAEKKGVQLQQGSASPENAPEGHKSHALHFRRPWSPQCVRADAHGAGGGWESCAMHRYARSPLYYSPHPSMPCSRTQTLT